MKTPFFYSFIVAVYNREKYLEQCINSILTQTERNFELIIVNDGSTDNSDNIIKSISDNRIKYFQNEHKGCWATMNYGILQSSGDFVCFIGSDDYISDDLLAIGDNYIKQYPDYDYYYPTELKIVKEDGSPTSSIWRYISFEHPHRDKLIKLFWEHQIGGIPHAASMIRRDVFQKYGLYNDSFFNLSDTAYVISNALNIKFHMVPELKSYYNRQHQTQTNKNEAEKMRTFSEILDEIIEKYPTELFLDVKIDKQSPEFYKLCVDRFMFLASEANHKEHYQKKAEKYLRLLRGM